MELRKTLGAAALVATAAFASVAGCSGRDDDDETPDAGTGCTGACGDSGTPDSGTPDSGTPDGGNEYVCPAPVNGMGPIGNLRASGTRGQSVKLEHVTVTAISSSSAGSLGDYLVRFWVVNSCFPMEGIFVDKYLTDPTTPAKYGPVVGDVVTVEGFFRTYTANGSDDVPNGRDAYRTALKNTFRLNVPNIPTAALTLTKLSSGAPLADNAVPANFGNSEGGSTQPNPEFAGARVYIPGPLTITNASPEAFKQRPDSGTYLGFEVTGGVLVANYKTFSTCDWRAAAADGGTVTFPNGLRGVWDTFTTTPCLDGGTTTLPDGGSSFTCGTYGDGVIPGTTNPYTYVLYPMDCTTDMVGQYDAGTP